MDIPLAVVPCSPSLLEPDCENFGWSDVFQVRARQLVLVHCFLASFVNLGHCHTWFQKEPEIDFDDQSTNGRVDP